MFHLIFQFKFFSAQESFDSARVNHVAVLADGQRALSGSDDTTLKLWDLATGACLRTLEGHSRGGQQRGAASGWAAAQQYAHADLNLDDDPGER